MPLLVAFGKTIALLLKEALFDFNYSALLLAFGKTALPLKSKRQSLVKIFDFKSKAFYCLWQQNRRVPLLKAKKRSATFNYFNWASVTGSQRRSPCDGVTKQSFDPVLVTGSQGPSLEYLKRKSLDFLYGQ